MMIQQLMDLYRFRELIQVLIVRDVKGRYRGTFLGFLWSLLNPLIFMGIYVVVFSIYLRIEMEDYPVFLLSGILPWLWFSNGMMESITSILGNGSLIKKVPLPLEIFPLVPIGSHMIHYLCSSVLLLGCILFFGRALSWALLAFPLILAFQCFLSYGLALCVSALSVQFRDLSHLIPNLLLMAFFLTPILYPLSMVPEGYRDIIQFNPLAILVGAYQDIFFHNRFPSWDGLALMSVWAACFLWGGLWIFGKRKDYFVEAL